MFYLKTLLDYYWIELNIVAIFLINVYVSEVAYVMKTLYFSASLLRLSEPGEH